MLLHGAGTGVDAPQLVAIGKAMAERGWAVSLIEQPYRVQGRKAPAPAAQLDEAVSTVIAKTIGSRRRRAPLVLIGRSSGGRVACRVATAVDAALVVALGFPLISPKGVSRQAELDHAGVPVLVVQGTRDSFGMPRRDVRKSRQVLRVEDADHALERPRSLADPLEEIVLEVAETLDAYAST